MLADDVTESNTLKLALGEPGHTKLREVIAKAHRFDLAEDFASAAIQISRSNMAAFTNALPACRAPAPLCWLEVPQSFRPNFDDRSNVEKFNQMEDITRVGILIEQQIADDGLTYLMHLFFKSRQAGAGISTLSLLVDLRDTDNMAASLRAEWGVKVDLAQVTSRYSGENLEAALALENRTCFVGNTFCDDMMHRIAAHFDDGGKRLRELGDAQIANWNGELMFWLSAIALLNTRNLGQTTPVTHAAMNKGRLRAGRPPLLSYDICSIDQSRFMVSPTASEGTGGVRNKRAHFVRGHFKMRKTGVFWWRPAVRGMAALGVKMKNYRVKHTSVAPAP